MGMKTLALGLLALTATAAPAAAQVAPAYASYNKTDAILGGKPSALAAIMAQQSGKPAPQFASAPQFAAAPSPDGRGALIRPAIYPVTYAPVPTDRPDVFGSVALPVSNTSLDARWRKVAAGSAGGAAIRYAVSLSDQPVLDRIDLVNRYVNRLIRFTNDRAQYGMSDRWMSGGDTLRIGKGDCEDYAIAKLQMLRQAGFASKDLYLVILRDLTRNADHAVLVVRAEGRLLVLDNGNNRIVDSATIADYRPILTFSGKQAWTHGYRRATPPVVLASAERPASNPVVQMASADRAIEPAGLAN
jgi:predicted transglutaminase-like cysteine proteinase